MVEVVAQNRKCPKKCPTVWVELGRGDVDLGKKGSLKIGKGKAKENFFENGGINEVERAL